ncbi:MAG: hypothetical protein ABSE49_12220 [Polyangiaceae bacterium]|jgi:hypothetical protein
MSSSAGLQPAPQVVVPTPRYLKRTSAIGIASGSPRSRAVGAVVRALADAPELPEPGDAVVLLPPTGEAFVRRVPGLNLWVWHTVRGDGRVLVASCATIAQSPAADAHECHRERDHTPA